ncbi:hypothetical protein B0T18DRAFT_440894 [Schizothecium vesticola]|uniref:MARVEL domain-containing protein n=1 Tax=Schizothecium vesticola TaxID=314040 RepID=A0AA40BPC7_9PEZI|nr:hypothetical protein B0T18DRAFT_440894 [Schizothecium vesticola]
MGFQAPKLGALGMTFTVMRACQLVSLIAVIGMVANFVSEIAAVERSPPSELIGALTVSITAAIYVVITYILYYDSMLPLLFTAILDAFLLIASIVVAALLGKPLSFLNCALLPAKTPTTLTTHQAALPFGTTATSITKTLSYFSFVAVDKPTCYEIKAVWALSIALCVLLSFSSLVCLALWQRVRRTSSLSPTKDPQ